MVWLVLLQVGRPRPAPVGQVDPLQERRDHLAQLGQHQLGVGPGLGQRMGPHAQQQGLVGLAGAVDADVGGGRGRQQAPQGVERLGPDRLAVGEVGVARRLGELPGEPRLHDRQQLGVGVEHAVHLAHVAGAERRIEDQRVPVVAVAAVGAAGGRRRCSGWTAPCRP